MSRRIIAHLMLALPLFFCVTAAAHGGPNFAGTWNQDNSRSTVPPNWTLKYSNKIEQSDSTLIITTTLRGGSRGATTFTRTYNLDGKPSVTKGREGNPITTTAQWKGRGLQIETVEKERGGEVKSVETWTLSGNWKTLTKTIHTSGPRGESDRRYVLERQQP